MKKKKVVLEVEKSWFEKLIDSIPEIIFSSFALCTINIFIFVVSLFLAGEESLVSETFLHISLGFWNVFAFFAFFRIFVDEKKHKKKRVIAYVGTEDKGF